MSQFKENNIPWNKGIETTVPRCEDCGTFIKKDTLHVCRNVDLKGDRFCLDCGAPLKNKGWERYSKICGRCGKIKMREAERLLKIELVNLFGGCCEKCGYSKYIQCLEFHHLFPEDKISDHFLDDIKKHPERFKLFCNRCHREEEIEIAAENKSKFGEIKKVV